MERMECEFCKKTFISKSNLTTHQKTTKYCLEIQGKTTGGFKCEYCHKIYTQSQTLHSHVETCKEKEKQILAQKESESIKQIKKLESEITKLKRNEKENLQKKDEYHVEKMKEKDISLCEKMKEKEASFSKETESLKDKLAEKNEYIAKLEAKLEKLEAKLDSKLEKLETAVTTMAFESRAVVTAPTTTTNTTTNHITVTTNNNVLNLSKEHVNKVLKEHLDYDVVYAGQAGFAKFVVDKMLKGPDGKLTYKCVDPSRQMFEFTDETGETVRDMRAEKLIQSLLDGDAMKIGLDAAAKGWNTDDRQLNNARTETFGPRVSEYTELNRHNTVFRNKVSSLTT